MTAIEEQAGASSPASREPAPAAAVADFSDVPYPGLRSFRRYETHIFFGREGTVNVMVDRLGEHRFLAVTGASGSGKSSLVKTGLLDALDRGLLASAGPMWQVADFRPGNQPIAAMTEAVIEATGLTFNDDERAIINARLARGPLGLVDWLDEIAFERTSSLLLLVDQFEELFRYQAERRPDEAEAFVALLLASAAQRRRPVYVVITMRSDFLGECSRFAGLAEAVNDGQFLTPRLTRAQCQAAIEEPARVYGGRVEAALVTRLLNDMGANPDQLPLMQHVLMLMWERASEKADGGELVLTLADYDALGGIGSAELAPRADGASEPGARPAATMGALSDHADRILARLSVDQQQLAATLFRALVQSEGNIGRDVRRPVSLSEAAAIAEASPAALQPVIEAFRAPGRHFLTPAPPAPIRPETIIDISHESLIRQWRTLRGWVKEEFHSAETYRHVETTAELWRTKKSGLFTNPYLGFALAWRRREKPNAVWAKRYGGDFALANQFLDLSERRHQLRQWSAAAAMFGLVVVLLAFGGWQYQAAQVSKQNAIAAREDAKIQAAKAKASAAELALAKLNFANELTDFKVPPQDQLKVDVGEPTPLTIPGATALTTPQLYELLRADQSTLLVDVYGAEHEMGIAGAWRIPFGGYSGSFDDETQKKLALRLKHLTAGDFNRKLVFFCIGAECWESYNASLRAEKAGYGQVYWYRGGLSAWQSAAGITVSTASATGETGNTESGDSNSLAPGANDTGSNANGAPTRPRGPNYNPQSISQYSRALIAGLRRPQTSALELWNVAVALTNAAGVLLDLSHPDAPGAVEASEAAVAVLAKLHDALPDDVDLTFDYADALAKRARALDTNSDVKGASAAYFEADRVFDLLVSAAPSNKEFLEAESDVLYAHGNFEYGINEWQEAITIMKHKIEIDAMISGMDPILYSFRTGIDYYIIGSSEFNDNKIDESEIDLSKSLSFYSDTFNKIDNISQSAKNRMCRSELYLFQVAFKKDDLAKALYYALACVNLLKAEKLGNDADDSDARELLSYAVGSVGSISYKFVLAGDFVVAERAARTALAVAPDRWFIYINLAHALMFQGKTDEARDLYKKYHGKTDANGWIWDKDVLKDFTALRKHGLTDPLMDEIEKLYRDSN